MTATATGTYVTATILKTRANITDTTDDTLLGVICDQVNAYIERKTGRILAPISSATYLYDGDGCRRLYLPTTADGTPIGGIRAITLLELAYYTGAAYTTVDSTQYFLRARAGTTGPYDVLMFTDYPSGGFVGFPAGLATVRITGTAGWAAIPDDIAEVAVVAAMRAWNAREAGQSDIVGTDEMGRPIVSRYFSARDLETLREYTLVEKLV